MKVNSPNSQPIQPKAASTNDLSAASAAKRADKATESKTVDVKNFDSSGSKPEISTKAREFAKAKEVAVNAPDIREQRIADLKSRIASGKYEINAQAIADRLVDEHTSSGIG